MSITGFPVYRPRRTRATENLRAMIRETEVSVKDLIYPLFVVPGENVKHEIESLPGNYHWSIDRVMECVDEVVELGIPAVLLFGVPSYKDAVGSSGWDMNEPVQQACKLIKKIPRAGYHYRRLPVRIHRAWSLRRTAKRLHRKQR